MSWDRSCKSSGSNDEHPPKLLRLAESSLDEKLAAAKVNSLFYVAGQQRLQQPFTLFICGDKAALHDGAARERFVAEGLVLTAEPVGQDAMGVLLNAAQPAPFGRRGEAVLDPEYRNALRLLPGTFGLSVALPTQEMMKDIASLMAPDGPRIYAQLDKLNIYGPGGMFKRHVDTPLNSCHFGSLVVVLPCAFEGGELVIRSGDATASLPLGGGGAVSPAPGSASGSGGSGSAASSGAAAAAAAVVSSDTGPPGSSAATAAASVPAAGTSTLDTPPAEQGAVGPLLHFAAFFSDLEHEVLPVKSGYRVTLTFNLFFDRAERVLTVARPLSGCYSPLVAELRQLLGQAAWNPNGVTLGYLLHHQYARTFTDVSDKMFPAVLKGVDRLLYAAMCETLGLEGKFLPVHWSEKYWSSEPAKIDGMDRVFVGRSFDHDAGTIECWELENIELEEAMKKAKFKRAVEMDVLWVGLRETAANAFKLKSEVMTYGNDWSLSTFYSGVAMLVKLPPWHSAQRERAITTAD